MDELEGEILALFGGSERNKDGGSRSTNVELRKRRRGEVQNSGSEDSISSGEYNKSKSNKKANEDKHNSDVENDYVDDWDSDLMGDDDDRARLNSLPEVERERILAERQEQRDILWERMELKRKLNEGMLNNSMKNDSSKKKYYSSSESERDYRNSSSRNYSRRTSSSQLQELRRKRNEKSSKSRSKYSESESEDNSEEYSKNKRYSKTKQQNGKSKPMEPLASLQELNSIRLSRDVIDKWIYTPMFDETVKGSLVRIRKTGQDNMDKYCIAEVLNVLSRTEPSYLLKRHYIDIRLMVLFDCQKMEITIDLVSNGDFTEPEYLEYSELVRTNEESFNEYLSSKYVSNKRKVIETKNDYIITAKDIDYRVKMFQEIGRKIGNVAHKKSEIHLKLQYALQENDQEE
ncbi:RNA polymerase-associated protein [Smittium mucronatum]|uniref:RNA polymerase-associated protein n=1 Tax=Smittium mucronatum TaxID=133383 RepID=A0A1R0H0S1_9FUNG|nr:RNA polymerase-associated protein [Smittium mucronatum]